MKQRGPSQESGAGAGKGQWADSKPHALSPMWDLGQTETLPVCLAFPQPVPDV